MRRRGRTLSPLVVLPTIHPRRSTVTSLFLERLRRLSRLLLRRLSDLPFLLFDLLLRLSDLLLWPFDRPLDLDLDFDLDVDFGLDTDLDRDDGLFPP